MTTRRMKKLAHSIYECKYHIVFCPKYRYKILQTDVANYVTERIYRLCGQKDGVEVLELNVQPDHVHMILSIAPKHAVSEIMGFLKGKLALGMFDQFPHLRKRYWGRHAWSRGYCVTTVGLDEDMIRKYVRWQNQREHDNVIKQNRLFE